MSQTMGRIIKNLRREKNLTQEELARRLNITCQAVSKWESEVGMPDISQIVPLASVFGVSADVLFGIDATTADSESREIVDRALAVEEYGNIGTYLSAYDMMTDGLRKYPSSLMLLNNCAGLGLTLSLPENGWLFASGRAEEISAETKRQARLIVSFSKNISDILRARQILLLLYSSEGDYDKAASEALEFPVRSDLTLYSNLASVGEYMGSDERAVSCLCRDNDYLLQHLEDNAARLGKAYCKGGNYAGAISVLETFFVIIKAIFGERSFPPYHDFDSGDCYILLAEAYLAIGETEKAMDCVEASIGYYFELSKIGTEGRIPRRELLKVPLLCANDGGETVNISLSKERLLEKLSSARLEPLRDHPRFAALREKVNGI